jgi:hypothetical protein
MPPTGFPKPAVRLAQPLPLPLAPGCPAQRYPYR